MRHLVGARKLGRTSSHRWAMFRNMTTSLVDRERIVTTLPRAKEMRSFADHVISLGKQNSLNARRQLLRFLRNHETVNKVFTNLAPRFQGRNGGYTRVLKLGWRHGDSAPMALIEYLPGEAPPADKKAKKETAKKKKIQK